MTKSEAIEWLDKALDKMGFEDDDREILDIDKLDEILNMLKEDEEADR